MLQARGALGARSRAHQKDLAGWTERIQPRRRDRHTGGYNRLLRGCLEAVNAAFALKHVL
jgi:hypothetical protein